MPRALIFILMISILAMFMGGMAAAIIYTLSTPYEIGTETVIYEGIAPQQWWTVRSSWDGDVVVRCSREAECSQWIRGH